MLRHGLLRLLVRGLLLYRLLLYRLLRLLLYRLLRLPLDRLARLGIVANLAGRSPARWSAARRLSWWCVHGRSITCRRSGP